jgi:hypothetical protein
VRRHRAHRASDIEPDQKRKTTLQSIHLHECMYDVYTLERRDDRRAAPMPCMWQSVAVHACSTPSPSTVLVPMRYVTRQSDSARDNKERCRNSARHSTLVGNGLAGQRAGRGAYLRAVGTCPDRAT